MAEEAVARHLWQQYVEQDQALGRTHAALLHSGIDLTPILAEAIRDPSQRPTALQFLLPNDGHSERYRQRLLRELVHEAAIGDWDLSLILVRQIILAMDRDWLRAHIGTVVTEILDSEEVSYWEYRRLAELLERVDHDVLDRLLDRAAASQDADIREVAEDYRS